MEPKDQRKVDDFIIFGDGRSRARRSTTPTGIQQTEEEKCATGTLIGSGIGGLNGHRRHGACC